MMGPDDNSPTVPNAQAVQPNQGGTAKTPANTIDASGKPPIWQPPRPRGPAGLGGPTPGGFGLGFAIALAVLAVMVLALVIALNVPSGNNGTKLGEVPTVTPTPSPTQNAAIPTATALPAITQKQAISIVTQFYLNISAQNYQNAYNLLSSDLQNSETIQQFQQQWQNVQQVTVDPSSIQVTPGSDKYHVTVTLNYTQVENDNGTTNSVAYQAQDQVGYDQNNLRILNIQATQLQTTPTPEPTFTPAPQPTETPAPTSTDTP